MYEKTKSINLCLGGGCAYNGTQNGKIREKTKFKNVWIPPTPSDAGSSNRCKSTLFYYTSTNDTRVDNQTPFLGPQQLHDESLKIIKQNRNKVEFEFLGDNDLINKTCSTYF